MKLLKPNWINHDGQPIFAVDIHPDNTRFATGGQGGHDMVGRIVIWNMNPILNEEDIDSNKQPKILCQLDHHNACVNSVRWSHSGRYLASGGDDRIIIIWKLSGARYTGSTVISGNSDFGKTNYEQWRSLSVLRSHTGDVLDLGWSPGDKFLASASVDNTVVIWDANNFPQIITVLKGHNSFVKGVTWDPVGKYVATQSDDRSLKIWRTSDWNMEHKVVDPFGECCGTTHVLRLNWSPDGLYLVSAHAMNGGGPTAQIIERDGWKTDKDFVGHRKSVVCVRFNKNVMQQDKSRIKQCCVALGSRDHSISVWSTALKRPVVVVKDVFENTVMDLSWSSCGTVLMACSSDGSAVVAKFSWSEIGKPLSSDEMLSLHHRVYGKSVMMNTCQIMQNIEVFIARKNADDTKQTKIVNNSEAISINRTPEKPEVRNGNSESSMKGPTDKQIETRTADGKRRITPKFLPPPDADVLVTETTRKEAGVFEMKEVNEGGDTTTLREKMMLGIDEMRNNTDNIPSIDVTANVPAPKVDIEVPVLSSNKINSEEKKEQREGEALTDDKLATNETNAENQYNGRRDSSNNMEVVLVNGDVKSDGDDIPPPVLNSQVGDVSMKDNSDESNKKKIKLKELPAVGIPVKRKRKSVDEPKAASKKGKFLGSTTPTSTKAVDQPEPIIQKPLTSTPISASPITHLRTEKGGISGSIKNTIARNRLAPLKIETVVALRIVTKKEEGYTLEVDNTTQLYSLKCSHTKSSFCGLDWTICTDAAISGISGDAHRIVLVCEDATVHVLDLKGRYAMPPLVLSGPPSKLCQSNAYLAIVTTKAGLYIWNLHTKKNILKSESLLPVLNQPGSDSAKIVDLSYVTVTVGGIPLVVLSNGKTFMFNLDMASWMLYANPNGLVSSPLFHNGDDKFFMPSSTHEVKRKGKPPSAVISHIKMKLAIATEIKNQVDVQHWLVILAKTMATQGLSQELRQLCEDLLGPTHSGAFMSNNWNPKIIGLEKRTILREILTALLEDLKWQDLFCEFDELLQKVEEDNESKSNS